MHGIQFFAENSYPNKILSKKAPDLI